MTSSVSRRRSPRAARSVVGGRRGLRAVPLLLGRGTCLCGATGMPPCNRGGREPVLAGDQSGGPSMKRALPVLLLAAAAGASRVQAQSLQSLGVLPGKDASDAFGISADGT